MTLPELPDEAIREAEVMIGLDSWTRSDTCGFCQRPEVCPEHAGESLLRAAWPHLYAAALRHAEATILARPGIEYDGHEILAMLHGMANEADPQVEVEG